MISFQKIKDFLETRKQTLLYCLIVVLIFIVGFGAGRSGGDNKKSQNISNYNTKETTKPIENKEADAPIPTITETKIENPAVTNQAGECKTIKGSKSKIYHLPGGVFYDRTKAFTCFASESEAQVAGYRKSSR
jgi:hypothetical protein